MDIINSNKWGQIKDEINNNALARSGGILEGDLSMSGNVISNIGSPVDDSCATPASWVKEWQQPWTYDTKLPVESPIINNSALSTSSVTCKIGSSVSKKFYMINSGELYLNLYFSSLSGSNFAGTIDVYLNDTAIISGSIPFNYLKWGVGAQTTPAQESSVIKVKKGDILQLHLSGDFNDYDSDWWVQLRATFKVNSGNPYRYISIDSGFIDV